MAEGDGGATGGHGAAVAVGVAVGAAGHWSVVGVPVWGAGLLILLEQSRMSMHCTESKSINLSAEIGLCLRLQISPFLWCSTMPRNCVSCLPHLACLKRMSFLFPLVTLYTVDMAATWQQSGNRETKWSVDDDTATPSCLLKYKSWDNQNTTRNVKPFGRG